MSLQENIRHLQAAVHIGNFSRRVMLLQNAVSDRRERVALVTPENNQGGVAINPDGNVTSSSCVHSDTGLCVQTIHMDDITGESHAEPTRTPRLNPGGLYHFFSSDEACSWIQTKACGIWTDVVVFLAAVAPFRKAVMKMDIEGHEHRAFVHATRLLQRVYVPAIFMEWMKVREYYGAEVRLARVSTTRANSG